MAVSDVLTEPAAKLPAQIRYALRIDSVTLQVLTRTEMNYRREIS
jgi:hypothetical protein